MSARRRRGAGRVVMVCLVAAPIGVPLALAAPAAASSHTRDADTASARIVLPSKKMVAGSTADGTVVVHNRTGEALSVPGCNSPFAVTLSNGKTRSAVAWDDCGGQISIPEGRSTFPVKVLASYTGCSDGDTVKGANVIRCVGGELPALPPGRYRARLSMDPRNPKVVRARPVVVLVVTR